MSCLARSTAVGLRYSPGSPQKPTGVSPCDPLGPLTDADFHPHICEKDEIQKNFSFGGVLKNNFEPHT